MSRAASLALGCLLLIVGAALASAAATRPAGVRVVNAWARATPPGVQVGAAYALVENRGDADRLLAVETTASDRVEMHDTSQTAGRMQMRAVAALAIPARGRVTFEPGGMHLMLVNLKQPLRAGEQVPLTFVFEKSGRIAVRADVAPIGSMQAPPQGSSHGQR